MGNVTLSGKVPIYHYTKKDMGDEFVVDPEQTKGNRRFYSNNDYKLSDYPRTFFYTDLSKTEFQIRSTNLYKGEVDGSKIISLQDAIDAYREAPDKLESTNKDAYDVVHALIGNGATNWDAMFETASKHFDGVYYVTGRIPMISMLKSIEVQKQDVS